MSKSVERLHVGSGLGRFQGHMRKLPQGNQPLFSGCNFPSSVESAPRRGVQLDEGEFLVPDDAQVIMRLFGRGRVSQQVGYLGGSQDRLGPRLLADWAGMNSAPI
ncbi:hypothetical protein PIB30_054335 [Stylosanthes scabra]|uniref:Uncharacterized protein n=1 Tax=Stylosanthes scabra TaxID=79078 RepID=A0ABU6VII5_9FABA|nr:hypothetical protein [Stylosanthes scabra]